MYNEYTIFYFLFLWIKPMITKKTPFFNYSFSGFFYYLKQNAGGSVSLLALQKTRVMPEELKLSRISFSINKICDFCKILKKTWRKIFRWKNENKTYRLLKWTNLFSWSFFIMKKLDKVTVNQLFAEAS